jgi:CDP-4-dehydro-6-deoxyglucose reductase/ferredoxin-NAD(P)+ reductase (naphthalene dioxygenase ferredoxin-specific)
MSVTVKISQWPTELSVEPHQTILDAALEDGVPYPHGCQSGNCGACKTRLYSGRVEMEPFSDFALTDEEQEQGFILACRSHPKEGCELAWQQDDAEMVAHPLRKPECEVTELDDMTHDIKRLRLRVTSGEPLEFSAGQYVSVIFDDQPPRDYSMANRPDEDFLEFHIRAIEDGAASNYVATQLSVGDLVRVEGPFGSSYLRDQHRGPIIAIAGGSGLAPIKSIVETAIDKGMPQPLYLYFGVRDERDLYLEDHFKSLSERHPALYFIPVLSEPSGETERRCGLVGDAAAADFGDFDGCKAYLAGPPVMVEAASKLLEIRDIRPEDIHADAFYTEAEKAALNQTS